MHFMGFDTEVTECKQFKPKNEILFILLFYCILRYIMERNPWHFGNIQSNNLNNLSEISFFAASNFSLSGGLSLVLT